MARFHKTRIGNAELIALRDSWVARAPGEFFPSVPAEAWDPYRKLLDADGNLTLNLGVWLIHSAGRTILVDTGIGGRPSPMALQEPAALPEVMEAAGVKPEAVEVVVFTHLHFDHCGWNTVDEGGSPVPLFPNARHVVQRREWEYWTGPAKGAARSSDSDTLLAPIERAGQLDLVEGEHAVTSEVVTVPTPGHTPGHVSFVVASGGERAYLLGDAAHQPEQLTETSWCASADLDAEEAARNRLALFDRIEEEGALIASGHFPFPGLGHAVQDGGKRVFRPLP